MSDMSDSNSSAGSSNSSSRNNSSDCLAIEDSGSILSKKAGEQNKPDAFTLVNLMDSLPPLTPEVTEPSPGHPSPLYLSTSPQEESHWSYDEITRNGHNRKLLPSYSCRSLPSLHLPAYQYSTRGTFVMLPDQLARIDESDDSLFYHYPRLVQHLDERGRAALEAFYSKMLPERPCNILDLCCSWTSHLGERFRKGEVVGIGMNLQELEQNPILTSYYVQNLNKNTRLNHENEFFDAVICSMSVDYLCKPLDMFAEIVRVLKPGGIMIASFSNRCFPTKVIAMWMGKSDLEHVRLVSNYFLHTKGFDKPLAHSLFPLEDKGGDPVFVVYAYRTDEI